MCRSREGAWIEMINALPAQPKCCVVAPARERGLKSLMMRLTGDPIMGRSREGAWIEIRVGDKRSHSGNVAPARERGLKSLRIKGFIKADASLPRGSVD